MNTFYEHHKNSIKLAYRCFDRILLNGLIQPFQQPERVIGFFNAYRAGERVTRKRLRDIAQQFQNWVKNRAEKWGLQWPCLWSNRMSIVWSRESMPPVSPVPEDKQSPQGRRARQAPAARFLWEEVGQFSTTVSGSNLHDR